MVAHMIKTCSLSLQVIFLSISALIVTGEYHFNRELTKIEFNPGCNISACNSSAPGGGYANLIHVEASGPADSLHYIVSSIGTPVIIIAKTEKKGAKLRVNWDKLLNSSDVSNSIQLDGPLSYSMAFVITRVIEFNDTKDLADLTQANVTKVHPMDTFLWEDAALYSNQSAHQAVFNASWRLNPESFKKKNGSLNFKVKMFDEGQRPNAMPRLEATANMSQIEFEIDNFTTKWNGSRFALEVVLLMSDKNDPTKLEMENSIDDEHTPGVFEIVNWQKNTTEKNTYAGFMQWKPVCYLDRTRGRSTGTRAKQYNLMNKTADVIQGLIPRNNIAYAFFGTKLNSLVMNATNVSFGLSEDKFYRGHNYTVWTASVGYGQVPSDGLSLLVIVIILAGLGIPFILMVFGGIFLAMRRHSSRSQYAIIQ